ncbi:2460_t:CDS:2 [Dentiscutata erythropus]|uniref:2460_t:CDS:1 n=1 Tax=Dentiscutata erythropus TaxID=1348616 RepID=A0A9N9H646_9GLOM|nr:2460_t:CDS:2 [Dentiscutata erythropus]
MDPIPPFDYNKYIFNTEEANFKAWVLFSFGNNPSQKVFVDNTLLIKNMIKGKNSAHKNFRDTSWAKKYKSHWCIPDNVLTELDKLNIDYSKIIDIPDSVIQKLNNIVDSDNLDDDLYNSYNIKLELNNLELNRNNITDSESDEDNITDSELE